MVVAAGARVPTTQVALGDLQGCAVAALAGGPILPLFRSELIALIVAAFCRRIRRAATAIALAKVRLGNAVALAATAGSSKHAALVVTTGSRGGTDASDRAHFLRLRHGVAPCKGCWGSTADYIPEPFPKRNITSNLSQKQFVSRVFSCPVGLPAPRRRASPSTDRHRAGGSPRSSPARLPSPRPSSACTGTARRIP